MIKRNSLEQQIANSMKKNKARKKAQRERARRRLINNRTLQMESLEDRIVLASDLPFAAPAQTNLFEPGEFLTEPSDAPARDIAFDFLTGNAAAIGVPQFQADDFEVTNEYVSTGSGTTHIYLQEMYNGLNVRNAVANINIAADGSVINAGGSTVALPAGPLVDPLPESTPVEALESLGDFFSWTFDVAPQLVSTDGDRAMSSVIESDIALQPITAYLEYVPSDEGLDLAWRLNVLTDAGSNWWDVSVDASTGEVLDVANWVANAQYEVFAHPKSSPLETGRTVEVDPHDATASPFGWHDTNGAAGAEFTITRGNNVYAYLDRNGNNVPDNLDPDGGAGLDFTGALVPLNLAAQPDTYQNAAAVNLFYWNNITHDILYQYGFDEAAGNFQENNYGNGGLGSDSVNAEAQDNALGGSRNNANFGTPPDGSNPRMQMFLWTGAPERDGDLDAEIIVHEYGHGVSNRLTGGPANAGALSADESGSMGEGWSDFLAMALTMEAADAANTGRGLAGYSDNSSGIRSHLYTYDFGPGATQNDLTYVDVLNGSAPPVHAAGTVWASMLWDLNWALTDGNSLDPALGNVGLGFDADHYNGAGGNNLALQLVLDGMKLQGALPTFEDARDGILAADMALTGGLNHGPIWQVFARRGLGDGADGGSPFSNTDGTASFNFPLIVHADNVGGTGVSDGTADTFRLVANGTDIEVWINGTLSQTVPAANVTEIIVNGSDDDDTLRVDLSGGLILPEITFDGGNGGGFDDLIVEGDPGSVAQEFYVATGPDSGQVIVDSNGSVTNPLTHAGASGDEVVINFDELEPVTMTTPAAALDVLLTSGADTASILDADILAGTTVDCIVDCNGAVVSAASIEDVTFSNKTLVTVNGLDGADIININDPDGADGLLGIAIFGNEFTDGGIESDDNAVDVITVTTAAAGIQTEVHGQGGSDTINVASGSSLDGIAGKLFVDPGPGTETLTLDDSADADADTARITNAGATTSVFGFNALSNGSPYNYGGHNFNADLSWDRPIGGGPTISGLGPVNYSVFEFQVGTSGAYDITSVQTYDGYIHLYSDRFDPTDQLTNLIGGDDDGAGGIGTSDLLGQALTAGTPYYVVTSAFSAGGEGTFANTISGPGAIITGMIEYANATLETLTVQGSTGGNTIDVNDTTVATTNVDSGTGNDNNTVTINGDNLSGANTFTGNTGNDSFILNTTVDLGANAVVALTSLQIEGNDPASDAANRDVLTINDLGGATTRSLTVDYDPNVVDISGFAVDVNVRTMETVNYNGNGNNDDDVTVNYTGVADTVTVTPSSADAADLLLNGGVAAGQAGPDLSLSGLANSGGLILDGEAPTTFPGDVLTYDAANGNKVITGVNSGTIENTGGLVEVDFISFEFVQPSAGNTITDEIDVASLVDSNGDTGADGTENLITIRRDGGAGTNIEILFDGDTGAAGGEVLVSTQPFGTITELTVNGAGDDDILFVDVSNGLLTFVDGILFHGNGQGAGGDTLRIEGDPGAPIQRETHFATGAQSGDITYDPNGNMGVDLGTAASGDEMFITYTGLEPVFDTVPVVQANFFTPAGAVNDAISITDGPVSPGGFQTLDVDATTFETQWFANKTTLTVNPLDGADTFAINFSAAIDGITTLELYGNELTGGTIDSDDGASDRFTYNETSASISTVNSSGQDGSDFYNNVPFLLDNLASAMTITGGESGGDADLLQFADIFDGTGDNVRLTSTQLTGTGAGVLTYSEIENFVFIGTAGADTIDVISTVAGTEYFVSGDGGSDTVTIGNESADFSVNADGSLASDGGSLDLIAGNIVVAPDSSGAPAAGDIVNVDDSGTAALNAAPAASTIDTAAGFTFSRGPFFGDLTGDVTELTGFASATIRYYHDDYSGNVGNRLEELNVFASDGDDTIDVNATTAVGTTRVDSHIGDDANTTTILGDFLSADNIFHGSAGFDRTVLSVGADLGATSFVPITSLEIHGDAPAADTNNRDSVEIYDFSGAPRVFTYDYLDTPGDLDLEGGFAVDVNIRTMENVMFEDFGANNNTVRVEGTSGVDQLTVAPTSASSALVFLGGNPWDGPSDAEAFLDAHPGVAGGGNGPDIQIRGMTGGITFDDGDASTAADDDQLFVYAPSETGINDGATTVDPWDPAGVGNGFSQGGAGQIIPAFGAPAAGNSHDDIVVTDALVTIDNGPAPGIGPLIDVIIEDPTEDFVKTNAASELRGLIVNTGDEAVPNPGDGIADDIFAVLSFNFGLQVNGGNPVPGFAPQGDRLQVITPGEINVFSDKSTPPEVSITSTHPITNVLSHPLTFSSIESAILTPGVANQQVNLYGDDNTAVGQEDNFVVVGRDIDALLQPLGGPGGLATNPLYNPTGATVDPRYDVDADGDNEFELFINGSAAIGFRNVTDLNVFGDDDNPGTPSPNEIDTLEITPYADDTPQGWDIDVSFDEGNPVQADGDQADLIILHTSLLGGEVSENIVVQPTGPEDGEIVVTNASSGTLIVDIDYVNNLDIIIIDDDGFQNDTDTLTLRGTDPSTPAASGRDIFDVNFGAAGTLAAPEVVVTDANPVNPAEPILYRLRNLVNIETVTIETLGGDDTINVTPDGDVAIEVYGGSPIGVINGDPDILNVITADNGETVNFFPGPEADSGTFTIAMGAAAERSVSFDEIELLQVDGVAFVIQDDFEEIDYNAADVDPNNSIALATDIGSDITAVYRDLTLHTTVGGNGAVNPTTTDIDYYRYTAHYTGKMVVNASFIHNDGNVQMSIQDSAGGTLGSSNTSAAAVNREDIEIPVVVGEDYFIRVSSADAVPTAYTLEIENIAAPVPSEPVLDPNDDSGWAHDDNVTGTAAATIYIQASLTEFTSTGVPILTGAQAAANTPGAAAVNDGAAVEVFVNGVSAGFATAVGASTNFFTFELTEAVMETGIGLSPGTLNPGDLGWLDLVTSTVTIFDGDTVDQDRGRSDLSEPMWMNFDDIAPRAANISAALLQVSDTNVVGDGVTHINQPAFWGVAEENTKIRLFADLGRDGTWEMVGEAVVGSDQTDVANNANLPEGSLGGANNDGLGLWEITSEPLRDGLYNIRVEVEDQAGNVTLDTDAPLAITVDTLAPQRPTVDLVGMDVQDNLGQFDFTAGGAFTANQAPVNSDTGLSTHDDITRGTNPASPGGNGTTDVMLRVSAEPSSNVLLKDGEQVIANFTMPAGPFADQGPGGDIFVFVLVTLDEDPHPLSAEAFDLAGNRSVQSEELLVTIDVTPPAVAAATDLIESSDTFDDFAGLTGAVWTAVDDNTGINTPTFFGVGEKNTLVRIIATDTVSGTAQLIGEGLVGSDESDGDSTNGLGIYEVQAVALADGVYNIQVVLEDTAGNINTPSAALQVTVDTVAPQRPTVDLQDSDDSGRSDMDNTTISDPAEANGVVDVRYSAELGSRVIIKDGETVIDDFIFNAAQDATDGGATDGFGLRRINFVTNAGTYGIPAEGAHPITVEAYDTPGNRSAQSEELLITIDFTPPAATPAPNLLSSSDSGQENDDNVTHIVTPAFDGTGERNSIVRVWATPGAGNTGVRQLIGEGLVGSNESDNNRDENPQIGIWEVTVEPLEDGVWTITTTLEDKAGNISAESAGLQIEIDTYQPNTPFLDLVENSDSGRHNDDNITNDTTPTLTMTSHDPNNSDHIDPLNFIFRIYDRDEESNEVLLYNSLTDLGDFTAATFLTETVALGENIHNLKLEVEDRAGNISEDFLLDILVDTTAFAGEGDLHPDSDSGVWGYDATMTDHYTNDKLPEFFGTAEANNLVIMEINSGGGYFPAGFSVATPLDGDDAFQPQNSPNDIVEGNWMLQTTIDDADGSILADGEHQVRFTYEDVAGNRVTPAPFTIFIDSEGPVVTNVTHGTVYEEGVFSAAIFDGETSLFDPKPSTGPEPLVSSIVVHFQDGPVRTNNYQEAALFLATAVEEGHFSLVGDANGVIPILGVNVVTATSRSGLTITDSSPGSDAIVGLELVFHTNANGVLYDGDDVGEPLPDDRFTLIVSDSLTDWAGNAIDGESSADGPFDGNNFNAPTAPVFPTGDGVHGGTFAARFTNDTFAELGVYAAGNIWVDTNGNFHFDPENVDASNRDITYAMGFVTDDIFAGNFVEAPGGTADGFDKIGGYGFVNGVWRWLIDTDNDGVVDIDNSNTLAGVNGLPFAGRFDGNNANGDEVAVFDGTTWWLDSDHSFSIDAGDTTFSGDMRGLPFAGDFDGDGLDDLGTWTDDHFYLDFAADGLDGNADADFEFGFIGTREAPIAADFDGDDIDDIGLWVPGREGVAPRIGAEWFVLMSHGESITNHIRFDSRLGINVADFEPDPFGYDLSATFGDEFARPVVGNFDPPNLGGGGEDDPNPVTREINDVDGDGDPATLVDAQQIIRMMADIKDATGGLLVTLLGPEISAPYGDHNLDDRIDLVDAFQVLRAAADRVQNRGGSAEGEGAVNRRIEGHQIVVTPEVPSIVEAESDEDDFFALLGDNDDSRWDGIADDVSGSNVSDEDVDDFFSDF